MAKKRIPIKALREFAKAQGLDVAVMLGWSQETGLQHVVTWGKTTELCDSAAQMGNRVKELAGWPPEECNAEPSRVKKLKAEVENYRRCLTWVIDEICPSDACSELEMAIANACASALEGKPAPEFQRRK